MTHTLYEPRKYLSISALIEFSRCPRRFFYHSGCRLIPPAPRPALLFGEAIHYAIGRWWEQRDINQALQAFQEVWDENLNDDKRNPGRALLMLTNFASRHVTGRSLYTILPAPPNTFTPPAGERTSPYEFWWGIDIGIGLPLVGRCDGWGLHRDTQKHWVIEYKTTSESSTRFLEGFTLNPQIVGYAAAMHVSNRPVEGVMMEALYVSKVNTDTLLQPIYVQEYQIDEFLKWARWKGTELLECEKHQYWPQQYTGCSPYPTFGMPGYTCDYQRLCLVEDWRDMAGTYLHEPRPALNLPVISEVKPT